MAFDISRAAYLPRVAVVYFHVDADPEMLRFAAGRSDGLVIAGAGSGEMSEDFLKTAESLPIPVMVSTRIDRGLVTAEMLRSKKLLPSGYLNPQKAAVLLRLMLL